MHMVKFYYQAESCIQVSITAKDVAKDERNLTSPILKLPYIAISLTKRSHF